MQSTKTPVLRCAAKTFRRATIATVLSLAAFATPVSPVSALVIPSNSPLQQQFKQNSPVTEVVVRRGAAVVRPGVRPGVVAGGWVRPSRLPSY
jgi:hypothetical protein